MRLSCRVFLRFGAAKAAKSVAREASKNPQCRNVNQEFQLETEEVVNDLPTKGAHYNSLKMHRSRMKYVDYLSICSTEVCEASLKDTYRRSN